MGIADCLSGGKCNEKLLLAIGRDSRPRLASVPSRPLVLFSKPAPIIQCVDEMLSGVNPVSWEKAGVVIAETFSYTTPVTFFAGDNCSFRSAEVQNVGFKQDCFAILRRESDWRFDSDSKIGGSLSPRIRDVQVHSATGPSFRSVRRFNLMLPPLFAEGAGPLAAGTWTALRWGSGLAASARLALSAETGLGLPAGLSRRPLAWT